MNRQLSFPVVAIAVCAALLLAFWLVGSRLPTASQSHPLVGTAAPEVAGTTAQGDDFRLSAQRNKVVLVNFWATWCGPCRMEIPDLIALQDTYKSRGFTVLGVSLDEGGLSTVRPFVQQEKMNYPVLMAPAGAQQSWGGIPAIPATFLVGKDGKIAYVHEGLATRDDLAPRIEKLL